MHVVENPDPAITGETNLNAVIVVTEAAQQIKVHTWAVNSVQTGEIITHITTIDAFYQDVRYLLPIKGTDTYAIIYERTIHMVLLSQTENELL